MLCTAMTPMLLSSVSDAEHFGKVSLLEMPLEDPNAWDLLSKQLDLCSNETVKRPNKKSKKRKHTKVESRDKSPSKERLPSVSKVVKKSFSQSDLCAPSKDVRKKLLLVNAELKSSRNNAQGTLSTVMATLLLRSLNVQTKFDTGSPLEMPLEDPTTWETLISEYLEPGEEEKRPKKLERSKKRTKAKSEFVEELESSEKLPSVSKIVKESFNQVELRGPSKEVRRKLQLANTALKSYFFKKHKLGFKSEQLNMSGRSRARSRHTSAEASPKKSAKDFLAQLSRSTHETELESCDPCTQEKERGARTKLERRQNKKTRSRVQRKGVRDPVSN